MDDEEETSKKMAILIAPGPYLPQGLTFGPTSGPDDFQELAFTVFARRLYKDWFVPGRSLSCYWEESAYLRSP